MSGSGNAMIRNGIAKICSGTAQGRTEKEKHRDAMDMR